MPYLKCTNTLLEGLCTLWAKTRSSYSLDTSITQQQTLAVALQVCFLHIPMLFSTTVTVQLLQPNVCVCMLKCKPETPELKNTWLHCPGEVSKSGLLPAQL